MSICIETYLDNDKKVYFVKVDGKEIATCRSLQECFKVIKGVK